MVTEDDNSTLGVVKVVVAVSFDFYSGHGFDGLRCGVLTLEAAILFSVDQCVYVVISKALSFLLISHKPGVPVWMFSVCRRREGCGAVAQKRAGRDERRAGLVM